MRNPLRTASVGAGNNPNSIVADPGGHHVYVVNGYDGTISQYAVGSGGGLMALSPATVAIAGQGGVAGLSASIDPAGRFLYVVNRDAVFTAQGSSSFVASTNIAQYSIGSDGTLTSLVPAYISVSSALAGPLAIDAGGQHAYIAGTAAGVGSLVFQFSINSNGTLAAMTPDSVAATSAPIAVQLAADGQTAYVLSSCVDSACNGQVEQFAIGTDGALTSTGNLTLTGSHVNPVTIVADGAGSGAYLLTNLMGVDTNQGAVYQYSVGGTGALTPGSPASFDLASGAIAESTGDGNLYALSANWLGAASGSQAGGQVDRYIIDSSGLLRAAGSLQISSGRPTAMTFVAAQ